MVRGLSYDFKIANHGINGFPVFCLGEKIHALDIFVDEIQGLIYIFQAEFPISKRHVQPLEGFRLLIAS